jgi:hypothetical protein
MSYEVVKDGASIPRKISERVSRIDGTKFPTYEVKVYAKGDVIADENVAPYLKEQYKDGDEHVKSLLKKVSKEENVSDAKPSLEELHQAEGGGPLDSPDKIQESLTGNDLEANAEKAKVVEAATAKESD